MVDTTTSADLFSTEQLLLAALLVTGGARVVRVEDGSPYSKIVLDLQFLRRDRLVEGFRQLADDLGAHSAGWPDVFDRSVLATVDAEYRRIKRLVVKRHREMLSSTPTPTSHKEPS